MDFKTLVLHLTNVAGHLALCDDGRDASVVEQVLGVFVIPFQLQVDAVVEQAQIQADICDVGSFPAQTRVGSRALGCTHQAAVVRSASIGICTVGCARINSGIAAVAVARLDFETVDKRYVKECLVVYIPREAHRSEISPAGIGTEARLALPAI